MPEKYPEKFDKFIKKTESENNQPHLCTKCGFPANPNKRCPNCGWLPDNRSNIETINRRSIDYKYKKNDPSAPPLTNPPKRRVQQPAQQYKTETVKVPDIMMQQSATNDSYTEADGWTTGGDARRKDELSHIKENQIKYVPAKKEKISINMDSIGATIPWRKIGIAARFIGLIAAVGLVGFGIYTGIRALADSDVFNNISISAPSAAAELEISAVQYGEVSDTAAAINWETSIPATGKVEYGISQSLGYTSDPGGEPATAHSVLLNSLQPETTYYFRVVSQPKNSDQIISGPVSSFITLPPPDIIPPVIIEVQFSDVSDVNATITWKTDEVSSGKIEYGTQAGKYTISADTGTDMKNDHMLRLPDLKPAKTYYFVVKSADASGNESVSDSISFTTVDYIAEGADVGDRAVDFTLPLLDGGSVTLSQYRGQLVLINFWFLSCGGCRKELPDIEEIYKTWSGNKPLTVLTIDIRDYKTNVISFMKKNGYTFPVLLDTDDTKIWEEYGVTVAPKTFFIDTNGIVRKVQRGAFNNIDEIKEILNSL